jgi:hypothetical protein
MAAKERTERIERSTTTQAVSRVREAHAAERRIAHLRSLAPNKDRAKIIAELETKLRA